MAECHFLSVRFVSGWMACCCVPFHRAVGIFSVASIVMTLGIAMMVRVLCVTTLLLCDVLTIKTSFSRLSLSLSLSFAFAFASVYSHSYTRTGCLV